LYAADEPNRIAEADQQQQGIEVERAIGNYVQYCLQCHGPAGEGYKEGTGRVGAPLGGDTSATILNQQGINEQGTPYSGGLDARREFLIKTIHNGRGNIMPAWGQENGGQLNDEQIEEIVTMIMHVDWNEVYNTAIETAGGYPTVVPTAEPTTPVASTATQTAGGEEPGPITITMHDNYFEPSSLTIPANQATTIHVVNAGGLLHNFSVPDLNISVDVDAGASADIEIPASAVGDYEFYCDVPGHKESGMVGTLTVSEQVATPEPAQPAAQPAEPTEAAGPQPVTITMGDNFFDPSTATIPAGTATTITIVNNGGLMHNFSLDDLGISVDIDPGATQTVDINAAAGTYTFHCNVPGHTESGMTGTLTVQ
jgi:uncharacterized cupredoxin-like copper-binding protein/mono/diheme cytochrome c family protein